MTRMLVDADSVLQAPGGAPQTLPAHRHLRAATRSEHAAAERVAVLAALAGGRIDAPRYAALLHALHGLFLEWEAQLRASFASWEHAGWLYRSRAHLLEDDLRLLGETPVRPDATHACVPAVDPAHAWGMLYVVEGAALGGRLLGARLATALPGCAANGYLLVGAGDGARWPRFCVLLDHALMRAAERERATAGARAMFQRYRTALETL